MISCRYPQNISSFSKQNEMGIIDIKLRCDIIQSKLEKLNSISFSNPHSDNKGIDVNVPGISKGRVCYGDVSKGNVVKNIGNVIGSYCHRWG